MQHANDAASGYHCGEAMCPHFVRHPRTPAAATVFTMLSPGFDENPQNGTCKSMHFAECSRMEAWRGLPSKDNDECILNLDAPAAPSPRPAAQKSVSAIWGDFGVPLIHVTGNRVAPQNRPRIDEKRPNLAKTCLLPVT